MYIVRWKEDKDYYTGIPGSHWEPRCKRTKLFSSVEEAQKFIENVDFHWRDKIVVEFMHPSNLIGE